jgi:hypothetical protein
MPARYEAIVADMRAKNKYRSDALRKKHAAMIENSLRRKESKPPMGPHLEVK